MKKSIVFINQSSGYLMIDIINAHVPHYDELVLLTGFLNPRETPLDKKVKVKKGMTYRRSSSIKRLLTWVIFWLQSIFYVFVKYRKSKLYFVSNPPLNTFTAKWVKRDFAFLIYDIYPEALAKNNIISQNSKLYKFWENSNNAVYRKAKSIFTLSQGMKTLMKLSEQDGKKVRVVPVWTNNRFFEDIPSENNRFIDKHNLKDKFVVSYSGNLGRTHPVEKIIDLAQKLKKDKDIIFLIIGEGDKKKQLLQKQKELSLPNLMILDFQPTPLFPHVLAASHIGVVTLESDAADLSVPSKTYNLMSAGKPILSISNSTSELSNIVEGHQIGKNFSEYQIKEMKDFILKLKNDRPMYRNFAVNSKKTSLEFSPDNANEMILN